MRRREFPLPITKFGCLCLTLFYLLKLNSKIILPDWDIRLRPTFYPDHRIFIDKKPDYFGCANETHNTTGLKYWPNPARAALAQAALLNIKHWALSDKSQTAVIAA